MYTPDLLPTRQELRRVLGTATLQPPTAAALEDTRARGLNSFVFNFASRAAQMQRVLAYTLLGLPQVRAWVVGSAAEAGGYKAPGGGGGAPRAWRGAWKCVAESAH